METDDSMLEVAFLDVGREEEIPLVKEWEIPPALEEGVPPIEEESILPFQEEEMWSNCHDESYEGITDTDPRSMASQTEWNKRSQLYSAKGFSDDASAIHFYTGLDSYATFLLVLHSLGRAAHQLEYFYGLPPPISVEDQFFLTLIKLRTHPSEKELSIFFGIDMEDVRNTFITWINFMYLQWEEITWWPSMGYVQFYAPSDFKAKLPSTRCILHKMVFPIVKRKRVVKQQSTYSTTKKQTNMKVLVASTPRGLVTFVSEAYPESTSDRQIIKRSKLPQKCLPGDNIIAYKGFNAGDLFVPYHVNIIIPTSSRKKTLMFSLADPEDKVIRRKRVDTVNVTRLAKKYKILCHAMDHTEAALATRIAKVVLRLCNFQTDSVRA